MIYACGVCENTHEDELGSHVKRHLGYRSAASSSGEVIDEFWEAHRPEPAEQDESSQDGRAPAWLQARLFCAAMQLEQPAEDQAFGEFVGVDAGSFTVARPSATMSDLVAIAQAIAPAQAPEQVWSTLEAHCPILARSMRDRGGWHNKAQCLIKAVLSGYWATALWLSSQCPRPASLSPIGLTVALHSEEY